MVDEVTTRIPRTWAEHDRFGETPDVAAGSVHPLNPTSDGAPPAGVEPDRPPKTRMVFVDICRAIGAILVVYSHLTEHWSRQHDHSDNGAHSPVIDFLNALITDPLHLQRQGIGQIAVPVFFLISGFVVTPIALKQGQLKFTINRFLRIYPALMFVVLLTAVVLMLGMDPLSSGNLRTVTPVSVLTNLLLVNYLMVPQIVLVGVAWTLIVEVLFYVMLIALLPLFRRHLAVALGVELAFVLAVLLTSRSFGDSYFLFAVAVSYIPIILLGQAIWAGYHRKIPLWLAGIYLAAGWSLYVTADLLQMGRLDTSYNLALAYAVGFFVLGLFAEDRLKQYRAWTELSERTYSIYLMHGLVAFPVLTAMSGVLPFELSALLALVATGLAVEVCYRFVEKPSHQLARRLTRRKPAEATENPDLAGAPLSADGGEEWFDADYSAEGSWDADGSWDGEGSWNANGSWDADGAWDAEEPWDADESGQVVEPRGFADRRPGDAASGRRSAMFEAPVERPSTSRPPTPGIGGPPASPVGPPPARPTGPPPTPAGPPPGRPGVPPVGRPSGRPAGPLPERPGSPPPTRPGPPSTRQPAQRITPQYGPPPTRRNDCNDVGGELRNDVGGGPTFGRPRPAPRPPDDPRPTADSRPTSNPAADGRPPARGPAGIGQPPPREGRPAGVYSSTAGGYGRSAQRDPAPRNPAQRDPAPRVRPYAPTNRDGSIDSTATDGWVNGGTANGRTTAARGTGGVENAGRPGGNDRRNGVRLPPAPPPPRAAPGPRHTREAPPGNPGRNDNARPEPDAREPRSDFSREQPNRDFPVLPANQTRWIEPGKDG